MILTVDVEYKIKAAVLRGYPLAAFCFCKRGAQKILKYFKIFTNTAHLVVASVGNVEKVFLEFEKRWKFILFP
jgi:hypothetical protein